MQRHSNSGNESNQAVDLANSEAEMMRWSSYMRSECLSTAMTLSTSSGHRESCEPYQIEIGKVDEKPRVVARHFLSLKPSWRGDANMR
jgi:hypothetical protein